MKFHALCVLLLPLVSVSFLPVVVVASSSSSASISSTTTNTNGPTPLWSYVLNSSSDNDVDDNANDNSLTLRFNNTDVINHLCSEAHFTTADHPHIPRSFNTCDSADSPGSYVVSVSSPLITSTSTTVSITHTPKHPNLSLLVHPTVTQTLSLSSSSPHFTITLTLSSRTSSDTPFSSNYLAPISDALVTVPGVPALVGAALLTPYDNDIFSMFQRRPLTGFGAGVPLTSAYVATLFDPSAPGAGIGLVVGSLDHTTWKSGVRLSAPSSSSPASLTAEKLSAFGGLNGIQETRDYLPHGSVSSQPSGSISSPSIFVGLFPDWRTGLSVYGRSQTLPRLQLPGVSAPLFGWNSWGASNPGFAATPADAKAASSFLAGLSQYGFQNDEEDEETAKYFGRQFVDYDAVDIDLEEQAEALPDIEAAGQAAGYYAAPWSWFSSDLSGSFTCDGHSYALADVVKKGNDGSALKVIDKRMFGTANYALDPTHPGVLCRALADVQSALDLGFKLVKLDFINWGAMEGGSGNDGSHALPNITTGLAAYNYGMEQIQQRIDGRMFISLSMAPTFPNHFANARRVGCDQMYGGVEYSMNQLGGGFWLEESVMLDPDLVVLNRDDVLDTGVPDVVRHLVNPFKMGSESRVNKAVLFGGIFFAGDDFTNETSVSLGRKFLGNEQVNDVMKAGKTFRPVRATDTEGDRAADLMLAPHVFEMDGGSNGKFVSVWNYGPVPKLFSINLENTVVDELFSGGKKIVTATDIWDGTNKIVMASDKVIKVLVRGADSKVLKFQNVME